LPKRLDLLLKVLHTLVTSCHLHRHLRE
jgi:hypothetical protein